MKIYKLKPELNNENIGVQFVKREDISLKEFEDEILVGNPQNGRFNYWEMEVIDGYNFVDLPKLWCATETLAFSERAKECFERLFEGHVEFIPEKLENSNLYIVNVLNIIDAIDYEKAKLRKLDTGLVVGIEKYAFNYDKIKESPIFKVLLNGRIFSTEVFVTSETKTIAEDEKLTGFSFLEVWDSGE